jgi:AraC-like DNA-binding protein
MIIFTNVKDASFQHSIDFEAYPIVTNRVYFIAENQTHQWLLEQYHDEFEGYFITFNEAFIKTEETLLKLFDYLTYQPFLDLSVDEKETIISLLKMIQSEKKNIPYTQSLLEALLHFIASKRVQIEISSSPNKQRFIQLRALIEKYYKREKRIEFYAKKMQLSSKRLNQIANEISTQSVTQLIHQRITLQAKRKLSLKQHTIQDISEALGFHDPAYFSRFFKKIEGLSPSDFMAK